MRVPAAGTPRVEHVGNTAVQSLEEARGLVSVLEGTDYEHRADGGVRDRNFLVKGPLVSAHPQ
jgi:hypothetical protein